MRRIHWTSMAAGALLGASVLAAQVFTKENDLQQLQTLLYEHGGLIEAAAGLSWPDGRQGTILYVKTASGDWFRCSDCFNADMQYSGGLGHWIERPEKVDPR